MPRGVDVDKERPGIERYRGEKGTRDIIAIMEVDVPDGSGGTISEAVFKYHNHLVWPEGRSDDKKPLYLMCREDEEEGSCVACKAAVAKPKYVDPVNRQKPNYACLIIWLTTKNVKAGTGRQMVGRVLPWSFGADKFRKIQRLVKGKAVVDAEAAGVKYRLYPVDIEVECPDSEDGVKYQKLDIAKSEFHSGQVCLVKGDKLAKLAAKVGEQLELARTEKVIETVVVEPTAEQQRAMLSRVLGGDDNFDFGENDKGGDDTLGELGDSEALGDALGDDAPKGDDSLGDLGDDLGGDGLGGDDLE